MTCPRGSTTYATTLAAAFDDADLAVQRRHKAAVDRLATIGAAGGPDRDLRDETAEQGKENGK